MGLERFVVASALRGIVAQRLVRRLCISCSVQVEITAHQRQFLSIPETETHQVYKPTGCPDCNGTGYFGRLGIFEILEVDDELADLLKFESLTRRELKAELGQRGVVSLREAGKEQILKGATSVQEVIRVT